MQIGVIGAGHVGGTLARKLVRSGHEVGIANAHGPATLRELIAELGEHACPLSVDEAASFGEVIIVSIPFGAYEKLPSALLAGRTVVDTMNYYARRDGMYPGLDSGLITSSELLQAHVPGARVVKAFNTVRWDVLRDEGKPAGAPGRLAIPLASDHAASKSLVMGLIDEVGFDAVDAGGLAQGGRRLQPGSRVYGANLDALTTRQRLAA
jgi:predicted dinucleotide-binding enzyme